MVGPTKAAVQEILRETDEIGMVHRRVVDVATSLLAVLRGGPGAAQGKGGERDGHVPRHGYGRPSARAATVRVDASRAVTSLVTGRSRYSSCTRLARA